MRQFIASLLTAGSVSVVGMLLMNKLITTMFPLKTINAILELYFSHPSISFLLGVIAVGYVLVIYHLFTMLLRNSFSGTNSAIKELEEKKGKLKKYSTFQQLIDDITPENKHKLED